ncbi:MAG: fasciclin domain-containing protein [Chloroflexi bacterium]|nr:fasciclin domain-containing protein [Chloroflexota bacterium]
MGVVIGSALIAGAFAGPAAAKSPAFGNEDAVAGSVYAILAADNGFDGRGGDYDILEAAAETVVNAKPSSLVAALNDPAQQLTVFAPNDGAFRRLVFSLTGHWYWREARVLSELVAAVSGLVGPAATIDTVETVLLYHVFGGGKVLSSAVPGLNGVSIDMLAGGQVTFKVRPWAIRLIDQDPDALNPRLVPGGLDIQTSNGKSVVHTISGVLRPLDLPQAH